MRSIFFITNIHIANLWFNYWFSFTLAYSRISHKYSSLFSIVINLIFTFSLWCIDWVGSLYANRLFMYSCIKSSIGTQGEVAIILLGEARANLSAFRTFVRFVLVWICRFPLPLGVWEGLRFVIVEFPGLFSYLFCDYFSFLFFFSVRFQWKEKTTFLTKT